MSTAADARPVRVLSIDGGGVRGYGAAELIARLEHELKTPARCYFDVVAGTSTGGLIAAGIACGRIRDSRVLADIYRDRAAAILPLARPPARLVMKRRRSAEFDQVLAKYMGETKLRDAEVEVVIPAFEATSRTAVVFTRAEAQETKSDVLLRDVVLATSAAPTYLPPHHVPNAKLDGHYIDGGVFANNPALVAWNHCRANFPERPVRVLSIGTGVPKRLRTYSVGNRLAEPLGLLNTVMIASSAATTMLMETFAADSYFRVSPVFEDRPTGLNDSRPQTLRKIEEAANAAWHQSSKAILEFLDM